MACRVRCQSSGGGFTEEQIEDFIGAMIVAGAQSGITVTYDDVTPAIDFNVSGGGGGFTEEQIEDFIGAMAAAGTQTGITVTYDDATPALDFVVSGTWTAEAIQDLVGAMATGGTQTSISVTYDDALGTLDFFVTPGAFDLDSFPNATLPLSLTDLFLVSQAGTEGKATLADIPSSGSGSNPYGLLADVSAVAADEFDDASIAGAWVQVAPGAGTVVWQEGNHVLSGRIAGVPNAQDAAILRPLSSFGGAWVAGSIVETSLKTLAHTSRFTFILSDGTSSASNAIGFQIYDMTTGYGMLGTVQHPYSVSFFGPFTVANELRLRMHMIDVNLLRFEYSRDGVSWLDVFDENGAQYNLTVLGWTPTHVGFSINNNGSTPSIMSADYVRRVV